MGNGTSGRIQEKDDIMKLKPGAFHETISKLLNAKLQPLVTAERDLNLVACTEIYTTIFETLVECISEVEMPITNEGMNYLAQQYYDGVLVNGKQELDPEIFTNKSLRFCSSSINKGAKDEGNV